MFRSLLASRLRSSSTAVSRARSTRSPLESVPPPSEERSWPSRLGKWLMASGWRVAAAESATFSRRCEAVAAARLDFADALFDIRGDAAADTLERIAESDRLHELWHLRAEIFGRVAQRHGQTEAERRLAALDAHFVRRARPSRRASARR